MIVMGVMGVWGRSEWNLGRGVASWILDSKGRNDDDQGAAWTRINDLFCVGFRSIEYLVVFLYHLSSATKTSDISALKLC